MTANGRPTSLDLVREHMSQEIAQLEAAKRGEAQRKASKSSDRFAINGGWIRNLAIALAIGLCAWALISFVNGLLKSVPGGMGSNVKPSVVTRIGEDGQPKN